ncbi:MAG TPA: thiol-disulfide oxidoreductase DCC family protein [Candidatus Binatia bacterium]|nr:thiol-disulfide oxidoreductase DCC family protein [Candidatus Binatia bacterium]
MISPDRWQRAAKNVSEVPNLILFDGVCNLCNASVQFVIRHDRAGKFRFAAIQSEIGREIFQRHGLDPAKLQTFVFITDGRIFLRSDAAIEVVARFGGAWKLLRVLSLVPRSLRDAIYSFIAQNRYRWFGRQEVCMIPTPEIKERFLDAPNSLN